MTSRQLFALLLTAFIWGGSFLYIRVLIDGGVEPIGVAAIRTTVGGLSLLPFAFVARARFPRDGRTLVFLAGLAVANFAAPWTLVALSEEHINSSVASIVNSAMPFWTAIFAVILTRSDQLRPAQVAGLICGFLGVAALLGRDILDVGGSSMMGIGLMLGATALAGVSAVAIRRWMAHVEPLPLAFGQIGGAALLLLPTAVLTGAYSDAHAGAAEIGSALALGGLGSGFAIVIFMWLIASAGPVRAAVVTYIIPPIGVFLGWAVLSEPIGWNLVAGLALIAGGVALVQGVPGLRPWVRLSRPPRVEPAEASAD